MRSASRLLPIFLMLFFVPGIVMAQANISLPPAYIGEPYSQSLADILRDNYRIYLPNDSPSRSYQWRTVGVWPQGLSIDPQTGRVFGTLEAQPSQVHRFLVRFVDRTAKQIVQTQYWLLLRVMQRDITAERSPSPTPPTADTKPVPTPTEPARSTAAIEASDLESSAVVQQNDFTLPLTIKNANVRQLEVLVFNKEDKLIDTETTPPNLPQGVRTSVTTRLEEGRNTVQVRNADTKEVYRSMLVTLRPTDVYQPGKAALQISHSGVVPEEARSTFISLFVGDPGVRLLNINVKTKSPEGTYTVDAFSEKDITLDRGRDEFRLPIKLGLGENEITVSDATPGSQIKPVSLLIKRSNSVADVKPKVEVGYSSLVGQNTVNAPLDIKVNDPKIRRIKVSVREKKDDDPIFKNILYLDRGEDAVSDIITLAGGDISLVKVSDVSNEDDPEKKDGIELDSFQIVRSKANDGAAAEINVNSLNTRAIVGFEQAGASAADSAGKPFLDFFFTAPIRYKPYKDELPRLSIWSDIRFASIPQQIATFGTFATNFVNPLAEGKLNKLVQGFDFIVGPEIRLFGTNKTFESVLPGVKQKTQVYLAGGFGAISPLNSETKSVQVFQTPAEGGTQRENFLNLFPEAKDKKYIAMVFPDRDRFLRQYYAGFRFKTHFYDDNGLINRFPAMFDLMFGQNEAVTGGKLRNLVMRLEGFYPLPLRSASFLYLYGTAMMKFGGGGVKISTPMFLDTADSTITVTNKDVFVAPVLQSNKDYYRIGIGVNLTELFNRKPSPSQK